MLDKYDKMDTEINDKRLLAACNTDNLLRMKQIFEETPKNVLDRIGLKKCLLDVFNIEYSENQFNVFFLKMDVSRRNSVEWNDFVSYIRLCFALRDDLENNINRDELVPPIRDNPRIIHSRHPKPINCVCFCPEIDKNHQDFPIQGTYVTVSQDGTVNRWSLDFAHIRSLLIDIDHKKFGSVVTVLTAAFLQDLDIFVFSTSQNLLQFYDTTAGQLTLLTIISKWENNITAMHYHVSGNTNVSSEKQFGLLTLGDDIGSVYVMKFSSKLAKPFQKSLGKIPIHWNFKDLLLRKIPGMRIKEFLSAHTAAVRQVSFYSQLNSVISCSERMNSVNLCALSGPMQYKIFHVPEGVKCFTFNEKKNILVTGGLDSIIRLWDIFINEKPGAVLRGHRAPIVTLVLQNSSRTLYSLDDNRVIKAWNVDNQVCLQSYIGLPSSIGEHSSLSVNYNPITRELIIASMQIVILKCQPKLNELHTDGFTHSMPVTVVIFNPLFDIVITCATDSIIMSWDIETGTRRNVIHKAHTVKVNGEELPVEITAATLNPGNQLLVTGARDGTLKVWNFNTKTCLRQMSIEHMNQVTSVIWVEGRILVSGWNRRVIEFDDSLSMLGAKGKAWESRHMEDISAAEKRSTATLTTVSFSGELVFWKLDTGRPMCQFSCENPHARIKIDYSKRNANLTPESGELRASNRKTLASFIRPSIIGPSGNLKCPTFKNTAKFSQSQTKKKARSYTVAHAVIFLETRPMKPNTANLFIALNNGSIQAWSEHVAGGYLRSFLSTHTDEDYVNCFATDPENKYLFCGTAIGYIKIWLMQNYLCNDEVHVNMPQLRLAFPFLRNDHITGRAKRSVRDQLLPILCSSYRAHLRCINDIVYAPIRDLVLSASADSSVRIWRLNGQYLNTLGSFLPWRSEPKYPPDIYKIASSTTFKVWNAGELPRQKNVSDSSRRSKDASDNELLGHIKDTLLTDCDLERLWRLPLHPPQIPTIKLDDLLPRIPIYKHLQATASIEAVERPRTPEIIKSSRYVKRMQHLQFENKKRRKSSGFI